MKPSSLSNPLRLLSVAGVVAMLVVGLTYSAGLAQDSTTIDPHGSSSSEIPERETETQEGVIPDPTTCTVGPRSDLVGLTAMSIENGPTGELVPADSPELSKATRQAVIETTQTMFVCLNANDIPRATTMLTDNAVAWAFHGGRELFGTPSTVPESERIEIVSDFDIVVLEDDRVAVRVSVRDSEGLLEPLVPSFKASDSAQKLIVVLVQSESQWLIDEIRP